MKKACQASALVLALCLAAFAALISYALLWRLQVQIKETNYRFEYDQAQLMQNALLEKVKLYLNDHPNIASPQVLFFDDPFKQYHARAEIRDEQSKFNLNNLIYQRDIPIFANILLETNTDLTKEQATFLAEKVYLWQNPAEGGFRTFLLLSQLTQIPGFTPTVLANIQAYISVLPSFTKLNIHTASNKVLKAFLPEGESTQLLQNLGLSQKDLCLQSHYFLIEIEIKKANRHFHEKVLLKKNAENKSYKILWVQN